MSFGDFVLSAGFNQKTAIEDIFVKGNYGIPLRQQRGKTLEDYRRLSTEAEPVRAGRPVGPPCQPPVVMSVLHRLKDCIFTVYSSRFDPRAHD